MISKFTFAFLIFVSLFLSLQISESAGLTFFAVSMAQNEQADTVARDSNYIRDLNEQAANLLDAGGMDSAKALIDEAISLSTVINDIEGEAFAVLNLASYYIERGLPDLVIKEVEPYFASYANTEKEIQIGNQIATAYNMLGNFQQGLELYLEMLSQAAERNETRMVIGITQNMGNNYKSLGDIPAALDSYLSSLEMAEEINDTLIIAVVLDNLASINVDAGNFELGENYLMRALGMNKDINNLRNQITNHMSLGALYKDMGRFEESMQNYHRVLELAEYLGNTLSRIQALYNLGMLHIEMEEYDLAMDFFAESLELSNENNINIGAYFNQNGMANVYSRLGEYEVATNLYKAALEIAENAQAADLIRGTLQNLYETSEMAGDIVQAYAFLKRYSAQIDSLAKTEREEALARQQVMLELRSEQENRQMLEETVRAQRASSIIVSTALGVVVIALIAVIVMYRKKQQANILLHNRTEELSEVNKMKDRLLSVLAHDLRSPISSIQGVVYMIREKLLEKEDIEKALNQIDMQLQQDINTLTNYLQWAQNQREGISPELTGINLKNVVEDAIFEIKRTAEMKGILPHNLIDKDIFVMGDKHMIQVILRNLLSNAAKFVNSGDRIFVEHEEFDSQVSLSVRDTGPGIPEEKLVNIFEPFYKGSKGTGGEIGTGLGLSICKEFAEKQGGTISVETEIGKGTKFSVTLNKATREDLENNMAGSE